MRVYARFMSDCHCTTLRAATRRIGALYDGALAPFGVSGAQFALLRRVRALDGPSLSQLAQNLELDRSTISRNTRVLQRAGLLQLGPCAHDKREQTATLTAAGAALLHDAAPVWQSCQDEIATRLGHARTAVLHDLLDLI